MPFCSRIAFLAQLAEPGKPKDPKPLLTQRIGQTRRYFHSLLLQFGSYTTSDSNSHSPIGGLSPGRNGEDEIEANENKNAPGRRDQSHTRRAEPRSGAPLHGGVPRCGRGDGVQHRRPEWPPGDGGYAHEGQRRSFAGWTVRQSVGEAVADKGRANPALLALHQGSTWAKVEAEKTTVGFGSPGLLFSESSVPDLGSSGELSLG